MKNNRRKYIKIIFITLLLFVFVISGCSKKVEVSEEFDYDGELKGNLANGQGTLYKDGKLIYEGQFADGKIHGQGKFYENGVLKYEGEIKNTIPLGEGIIYSKTGKKLFAGTITENDGTNYKGAGTVFNENEEPVYEGDIVVKGEEMEFAGKGKILYPDGSVFYDGEIKEGMPADNGTYYDPEGKEINK